MELENEFLPDLEEKENFKKDNSQKYSLHFYIESINNFLIEDSILFNFNKLISGSNILFSTQTQQYYEHFCNLLAYSKNKIRLYNVMKFHENEQSKENYTLQLISEYNIYGNIQTVLLYEKYEQTYFIISLDEAKVPI